VESLDRDRLFVALTRPQMFLGVTYSFLMINVVVSTEIFLIFKSFWVIGVALALHALGWIAHLYDPRIFDLWIVKASRCPRIRNWSFLRCNSYSPS
jgi:type IV secretion system protein VirB3